MRLVATTTRWLCCSAVRTSNNAARPSGQLWKPAAFTLLVGGVSYTASGVYVEEFRRRWNKLFRWAQDGQHSVVREIKHWWWNIGTANRFTVSIIAANVSVFVLWRIPAMHHVMEKYFLSSTTNKSSLSILLSEFSHLEVWHLGINMLVLWSFAPALLRTLGDTITSCNSWPYYLTAGAFASMTGYYAKLLRRSPLTSLGASGALMAVVSLVVFNNPSSQVYIIFLPFIPLPSSWALGGVVAMDVLGLVRGWKFFDHAGHLGGVLFALLYQFWLHRVFGALQYSTAKMWHRIRTSQDNK